MPPYIVPLSAQSIEIVRYLLGVMRPAQKHLLAHRSELKTRISENALNAALKRMRYEAQLTGQARPEFLTRGTQYDEGGVLGATSGWPRVSVQS